MDESREHTLRHKEGQRNSAGAINRSVGSNFYQPSIHDSGAGIMSLPTILPSPGITDTPIFTPYEDDEEDEN